MKMIHVAMMVWAGEPEPICAGTNIRKVRREALRLLREEHGSGPVDRGSAMCWAKIVGNDIEIATIPMETR